MEDRFARLTNLDEKFGFLLNTSEVLYGEPEDLKARCLTLAEKYKSDVNGDSNCTKKSATAECYSTSGNSSV